MYYRTFVRLCLYRKNKQKEPRNFYEVLSANYILLGKNCICASLEANRNTRLRTCGSDERLMLPPGRGDVPVAVLLIRCRPECHSKAGFSLDYRTSGSIPTKTHKRRLTAKQ